MHFTPNHVDENDENDASMAHTQVFKYSVVYNKKICYIYVQCSPHIFR